MEQNKKRKMYELIAVKDVEIPSPAHPDGVMKKTYWNTVGRAWPLANGSDGLSLEIFMFGAQRFVIKESLRNQQPDVATAPADSDDTPF